MIAPTFAQKQYASAHQRLLPARIADFFDKNFPKFFGPEIRDRIAQRLLELIEEQMPPRTTLRPGQCLWNAVAIETRADSPKRRLVPVVLTLVDDTDITRLAAGASVAQVAQDATARLLEEAYQQGALLSMRDLAVLTWHTPRTIVGYRQAWETAQDRVLPHPGTLQDMGSCLTHKTAIVVKTVYERHDPRQVARETKHTQQAVDRYLKDFHRVRTCYRQHPDQAFVCQVTGMSPFLVKQYIDILEKYEPNPLTGNIA
jgi:hypothetical protein